jgi:Uma2 family endonuclease
MAMIAPTQPPPEVPRPVMTGLTWQEFLDLPEECKHADLINGDLFVSAPTPPHQRVVSRLVIALGNWTAAGEGRGEVTIEPAVQIRHDRGYMPDVAWWREDNCAPPDQAAAFEGPPDLVVEVLSSSTRQIDVVRKSEDYPRIGVTELWLIDPDEPSAHIVRAVADGQHTSDVFAEDELRSPLLDGFAVRLGDLVRR